jgi:hypothetical protein
MRRFVACLLLFPAAAALGDEAVAPTAKAPAPIAQTSSSGNPARAMAAVESAKGINDDKVAEVAKSAEVKPEDVRLPGDQSEKAGDFTCVSTIDQAQLPTTQAVRVSRQYAQDHCTAKFFGPSFVTSVSVQAGLAVVAMTANHHKPLIGAAANASLPILWSWRVKSLTSKLLDPSKDGDSVRTLTLPYSRFHQTWIDGGLEPAVLTTSTFNNQDVAVSTTVLAVVGVRRTWTWWSDPENFASKNTFGLSISLFGGWGAITPKSGSAYAGMVYGIRVGLGSTQT